MRKETIKYDKQFKQTVLDLLENGSIPSMEAARRIFNIKGSCTIQKWMKQQNRLDLLPIVKTRRLRDELDSLKNSEPELYDAIQKTIAA